MKLDGVELEPGRSVPLVPGARLELGDVRLTFYDAAGFYARIDRLGASLTAKAESAQAG